MIDREVQELRLQALKELVSQSDIEELYARDEATLERLQSLIARTEIPREVDEAVSTFLAEYDIDLEGVDPLVKPALHVLFQGVRDKGWKLKTNVLATRVCGWIVDVPTAELELETPSPSIFISSCHECGKKFDEQQYFCSDCRAFIKGQ